MPKRSLEEMLGNANLPADWVGGAKALLDKPCVEGSFDSLISETELNLHRCDVSSLEAKGIAAVLKASSSLTAVNLSCNQMSEFECEGTVEGDSYTRGATVLFEGHELVVVRAENDDCYPKLGGDISGVAALARAISVSTSLTSLDLSECGLGEKDGVLLKALVDGGALRGKIKTLNLVDNGFYNDNGSEGARILAAALSVPGSLKRCDVRNKLGRCISFDVAQQLSVAAIDGGLDSFNGVPIREMRSNTVVELRLLGHFGLSHESQDPPDGRVLPIGVEGGHVVATMLPMAMSLTALDTRNSSLCAEGAAHLAAAVVASASLIRFGEVPMAELRRNQLTALELSNLELGNAEAIVIGRLAGVSTALTTLSLHHNRIGAHSVYENVVATPEGPRAIADAILASRSLTSVDLSFNLLSGSNSFGFGATSLDGVGAIADALRHSSAIKVLKLGGNDLAGEHVKVLAASLQANTSLTLLNLSDNNFWYDNLSALQALSEALVVNTSMTALDVSRYTCGYGDLGTEHATALELGVARLTSLKLHNRNLPPEGAKLLRESMSSGAHDYELLLEPLSQECTSYDSDDGF